VSYCLLALLGCGPQSSNAPLGPTPDRALWIATQNAHYISLNEPTGAWSVGDWQDRKASMDLAFKALNADIIGFQKMESFASDNEGSVNLARDWLLQQNPSYAVGANGDWRSFPSTQPIFYRTDSFTLLAQGWFFFSDTPDIIYSRTFDGSYPAFASTVRLRDSEGKVLNIVNVHFEHKSGSNRLKSSALVAERMAPLIAAGERVILIGDINALRGLKIARILEDVGFDFLPVQ